MPDLVGRGPSDGWDAADAVTTVGGPTFQEESRAPSVRPTRPAGDGELPGGFGPATARASSLPERLPPPKAALSAEAREEIWTIVRAAVDAAVAPLLERQRGLEDQLARALRAAEEVRPRGESATSKLASLAPPIAVDVSFPPPALPRMPPASADNGPPSEPVRKVEGRRPEPVAAAAAPMATIPDAAPLTLSATRTSIPPSHFPVVPPSASRLQEMELRALAARTSATEFEGYDGGRRKGRVAMVVVILILLAVGAAITATVMSHS